MASAGTAVKVLLVVAVVVAIAAVPDEETVPRTPNQHPIGDVTFGPRPTTSTNVPGGGLRACAGEAIFTESAPVGRDGGLTLQVFYAATDGGRTCAMATKTAAVRDQPGELTITLQRHNYDGRRWPRYAVHHHRGTDPRSAAIYLDQTNGRCVRAEARFDPDRGSQVRIASGKIGCERRDSSAGSLTPR